MGGVEGRVWRSVTPPTPFSPKIMVGIDARQRNMKVKRPVTHVGSCIMYKLFTLTYTPTDTIRTLPTPTP